MYIGGVDNIFNSYHRSIYMADMDMDWTWTWIRNFITFHYILCFIVIFSSSSPTSFTSSSYSVLQKTKGKGKEKEIAFFPKKQCIPLI